MLPIEYLRALARCQRAFEIYLNSDECDGYWICIDALDLSSSFKDAGLDIPPIKCQEYLHELSVRGILTSGDRPQRVGGFFYYKNSTFEEIIFAAIQMEDEGFTEI